MMMMNGDGDDDDNDGDSDNYDDDNDAPTFCCIKPHGLLCKVFSTEI